MSRWVRSDFCSALTATGTKHEHAVMRLSGLPYTVVRIRCSACPRAGSYKLARLAERFGAEIDVAELVMRLSADCPNRSIKRHKGEYQRCGAHLPDNAGLPEPEPPTTRPPAPALRVVGRR